MNTNKVTPTVEEKAESKSFFTKRNIIIIVITTLISLGLAAVTLFVIFDPTMWSTFFINIDKGIRVEFGPLWLSILIVFAGINIIYNIIPIWLRLKQLGVKIKFWQWLLFGLTISFMKAVTPANFIYDPYTIFWLKTQGVSTSRATSILFSNALMWQSAVLLIHIPSFIFLLIRIVETTTLDAGWLFIISLMSIGILVDIIGVLIMVLLCFSSHAHYFVSSIFNWIKKKLHIKYKTKEEIIEKYRNKAVMKKEVIEYYKDWQTSLVALFVLVAYELIVYFTLSASLALMNGDHIFTFDVIYVFHSANMAFNANRLNLVPGFGIGLEASLLAMLRVLGGISSQSRDPDLEKHFVEQGIVLWRTFYTYVPAVFGLFAFGGLTGVQIRSYRKKKAAFIADKYE